jgi:hypothetical protein
VADEQGFSGGVYDFGCECVEVVERLDSFGLSDHSVYEAEVAAGDPDDGSDCCGVTDSAVSCRVAAAKSAG